MGMIGLATRTIPKLLDPLPGGAKLVDAAEFLVAWARANSLWPLIYGTACCAMEMMSAGSSRHDWARFGVEVARATPRQADLIVLAGTITEKMGSRLITLYQQMPGPKYVIAMGSCAISGGPFYYDSYSVVKGGDRLIPVDVYIPGCPPRPEALLHGIMELQKKIRTEGRRNPWEPGELLAEPPIDPLSSDRQQWAAAAPAPLAVRTARRKPTPAKLPAVPRRPAPPTDIGRERVAALLAERFGEAVRLRDLPEGKAPEEIIEVETTPEHYQPLIAFLRDHRELGLDFLLGVTAVDRDEHFEVLVHLQALTRRLKLFVRCPLPRERAEIESISHLYGGAAWHEREVYDLFGINFRNHPDLRRIFLDDDFPGYPMRKDFHDPQRVIPRPY